MILQLIVGSLVIVATVVVQVVFIALAMLGLQHTAARRQRLSMLVHLTCTLALLTLWLLGGITLSTWLWAGVLILIGEYNTLEASLYFASVSITTLGFGDVLLSDQWRLLSGFIAADGLLLFSLSTAFMFDAWRSLHQAGR